MIYHVHNEGERDAHTLDDLAPSVRDTVKALREHLDDFDTIATQGMSGVLVASPVSLILKKELTVVRKDDGSHQYEQNTGRKARLIGGASIGPGKRALFLDDFISLGDTRDNVYNAVEDAGGIVVGTYTYQNNEYVRRQI